MKKGSKKGSEDQRLTDNEDLDGDESLIFLWINISWFKKLKFLHLVFSEMPSAFF